MDRESNLPLVISALLAVALHASVFLWPELTPVHAQLPLLQPPALVPPVPAAKIEPPTPPELPKPEPNPPKPKPEPVPQPEPKPEPKLEPEAAAQPKPPEIGRDGEPVRSTIAWIPYDDFKELMAAQSLTIQPALQQQVDPVANAPVEMNPTSPAPTPTLVPNPAVARKQQEATHDNASPTQPPPLPSSQSAAVAESPQASSPASSTAMATPNSPAQPNTAAPQTDPPVNPPADSQIALQDTPQLSSPMPEKSTATPKGSVVAAPRDPAKGRSADILIPQGSGSPALDTANPSPDRLAPGLLAQAEPPDLDSSSSVPDTTPRDVTVLLTPSQPPASAQPKDSNQLAMAALKLPQKPEHTQVSPSENEALTPLQSDRRPEKQIDKQPEPAAAVSPDNSTSTLPAQTAKAAAVKTDSNEHRPTSVPRSDRESIATQTSPMPDRIVLGKVLVSDGIEIKTARANINISTLYTAWPRNPVATIVFDKTGQVVHAQIIRSSGFADVDSPVLNSLYRWRASGKKLQEHKSDTFTIAHMTLLFVEERKTSNDPADATDASPNSSDPNPSPDSTGKPTAPTSE